MPVVYTYLYGTSVDEILERLSGNWRIYGRAGNDVITTGAGNDYLYGEVGNDVLKGGGGLNFYSGGRGFDVVRFEGGILDYDIQTGMMGGGYGSTGTGVLVTRSTFAAEGKGTDRMVDVEALSFDADAYTFYLDGRNNRVLAGDDAAMARADGPTALVIARLLANDTEFDGDTLAFVAAAGTSAAGATITRDGARLIYDAGDLFAGLAPGASATDSFTYLVDDGLGGTDSATVTLTITADGTLLV